MSSSDITPKNDATLGLIFRLNYLWALVDTHAREGRYDSWNNTLDTIYRNLLYRNEMKIDKDVFGEIKDIKLSDDDSLQYKFLNKNLSKAKLFYLNSSGKNKNGISNKKIARSMWYKALHIKDIWIRKLMASLNLYIKETRRDPGGVMGW